MRLPNASDEPTFSVLGDKRAPEDVASSCLAWCPTMDLVAVVTVTHKLLLYRLSWQKIWSLPPADTAITSICWSPGGKALAVGFEDGTVRIHGVENGQEIQRHSLGAKVITLCWNKAEGSTPPGSSTGTLHDFEDRTDDFLMDLPPLPESNLHTGKSPLHEAKQSLSNHGTNDFDILVIGVSTGSITMFALGTLRCGDIAITSDGPVGLVDTVLSKNLSTLSVVYETGAGKRVLQQFSTSLLFERRAELRTIALQCAQVTGLLNYLSALIKSMETSWESILLELDTKLTAFAANKGGGALSLENEFMALLAGGVPSIEMEGFLSQELTTRKLKKMGAGVEGSYNSIQKLILEHMNKATEAMMFRLGDLNGLASWQERFGHIGIDFSLIQPCISLLGAFSMKAAELLRVIDQSKQSFNAFFTWLQRIVWMIEVPDAAVGETKFDARQVARFIKDNFAGKDDGEQEHAMIDNVGQYFASQPLRTTQGSSSRWPDIYANLVKDGRESDACYLLFDDVGDQTLVQAFENVEQSVLKAFSRTSVRCGETYAATAAIALGDSVPNSLVASRARCDAGSGQVTTFLYSALPNKLLLVQVTTDSANVCDTRAGIISLDDSMEVHAIKEYSDTLFAILVGDSADASAACVLALVNLELMADALVPIPPGQSAWAVLQGADAIDGHAHIKAWQGVASKSCAVAVSGSRQVACVVMGNKKNVQLLDLAIEEEDSDDEDEDEDEDENDGEGGSDGDDD